MAASQTQSDDYTKTVLEMTVRVNEGEAYDEGVAVASAVRHASAHSPDFAVNSDIFNTEAQFYEQDCWMVIIKFDYIHVGDSDLRSMMNDMVDAPNVVSVEKWH